MKKQKENSHEGITWSEMGKQNVQAEKVYCMLNQYRAQAKTTATAKTTPENNDMIGWMTKNNRAARAARTLVQFSDADSQTTTWNFEI